MSEIKSKQRMILCKGLQSGGSTILSWCFLQRNDTNGVLDMPNDVIQMSFDQSHEPILWCKMTIGAFRWLDVCDAYRDLGWDPQPVLIVRDVRAVFASLLRKKYGFNGTTAEDPPLRLRFRRFLHDWELIKYEEFIMDWSAVLRCACHELSLPWDEAMVRWPKKISDIAYVHKPNKTFMSSLGCGDLAASIKVDKVNLDNVPTGELRWLEKEFSTYNHVHEYPAELPPGGTAEMPPPRYEGTARDWYYREIEKLWTENDVLRSKLKNLGIG